MAVVTEGDIEMIFRNAMQTPDGTIIESKFRHDYVTHDDQNGEMYMVDGGRDYFRRTLNKIPAEDLSVESKDDDHEFNRKHFLWGTYGKNGGHVLKQVTLESMDLEHINAILDGRQPLTQDTRKIFEEELKYRA